MMVVGDRYRLERELGTGGSAAVWLAHDLVLDRTTALKLLLPVDQGGDTRRERLRTEARALAALDHPNVVRVFDLGHHADRDYIVMEYLERGSLADRQVEDGPLAPIDAVDAVIAVLAGLEAAHAAGIVHRDVKPGNVLIRADGTVALCDFGIARTDLGSATRTGVALGSIGYMAPEQRIDARRVGPAADVYAAACTLYNLLTTDTPVDLYLAPDTSPRWEPVPAPLRPVVRRATRAEPSARFASAAEMAEALHAVRPSLAGLPPARIRSA
ncbi:MAG: serine/threonine-protein kinase, partial [Myxococcota bacterium]